MIMTMADLYADYPQAFDAFPNKRDKVEFKLVNGKLHADNGLVWNGKAWQNSASVAA